MRTIAFAACLLALGASAQGQPDADRWFAEINRDVWTPFTEGVRKDDSALYLGVRSTEYVRVQASGRLLLDYADYVDDTVKMMAGYRAQGTAIVIDVRFEERIIDGKSASERGIQRVLFTPKGGETRTFYTRFHTISRKEGGKWRVLTDYFPASTDPITEAQYAQAKALDDVASFRCHMRYPEKKQRC